MRRFLVPQAVLDESIADARGTGGCSSSGRGATKQARIEDMGKVVVLPKLSVDAKELLRLKALLKKAARDWIAAGKGEKGSGQSWDVETEQRMAEALRQLACYMVTQP
jgi:hypothetical protein